MTGGSEQPRVLPTDDYEDYRRRVHYTAELLWMLGAGQQLLMALHALLVEHTAYYLRGRARPLDPRGLSYGREDQ